MKGLTRKPLRRYSRRGCRYTKAANKRFRRLTLDRLEDRRVLDAVSFAPYLHEVPSSDESNFWWLDRIRADVAWDITTGASTPISSGDVVIAVPDSGVDYTHPEIALSIWINPFEIPPARTVDSNADGQGAACTAAGESEYGLVRWRGRSRGFGN